MKATANLPEPTYGFKLFYKNVKSTMQLMKTIVLLTKRVLML